MATPPISSMMADLIRDAMREPGTQEEIAVRAEVERAYVGRFFREYKHEVQFVGYHINRRLINHPTFGSVLRPYRSKRWVLRSK